MTGTAGWASAVRASPVRASPVRASPAQARHGQAPHRQRPPGRSLQPGQHVTRGRGGSGLELGDRDRPVPATAGITF